MRFFCENLREGSSGEGSCGRMACQVSVSQIAVRIQMASFECGLLFSSCGVRIEILLSCLVFSLSSTVYIRYYFVFISGVQISGGICISKRLLGDANAWHQITAFLEGLKNRVFYLVGRGGNTLLVLTDESRDNINEHLLDLLYARDSLYSLHI